MNILNNVRTAFATFAARIVADTVAEGAELGQKLLADGKAFVEKEAAVIEGSFEDLVNRYGKDATQFVTDLFGDAGVLDGVELTGSAKADLAARQLIDKAAQEGVTIAAQDATSMVKTAFLAVVDEIAKL